MRARRESSSTAHLASIDDLQRRLAEAESTIAALITGQIDAVVDRRSSGLVLLSEAQAALHESEARYRRIVETTSEGIWTADGGGRITFVNRALAEMLGYGSEEMLGRSLLDFLPATPEAAEAHARRALLSRTGVVAVDEVSLMRKDGREQWVLLKTSAIHDADDSHAGTLAMMTDRTSVRQAEASLRHSEALYRQIVETTTDGIVKLDRRDRIEFVNHRFAEMLGYPPAEMLGQDIFDFISPAAVASARPALQNGSLETRALDTCFRHARGCEVAVNVASSKVLDGAGTHVGHLAVVRDVTEQKKLEAQLMVSDRMASVGTLAAGVAHEINNPLAVIIANLEFVARGVARMTAAVEAATPAGEQVITAARRELDETLADTREASERVRLIVRDLGVFSRSPDEKEATAVDLKATLESTLRMARNEIRHRAHVVEHYGIVPPVAVNEARLGQVFLNLVVNAAQALPEGRAELNEIRVVTRAEGGRVLIEVSDTGPGIPASIIGRVFDAFFTTKAAGVGVGLGLAICQRIIKDMEGELTVESEMGVGTTFRVSLPMASAQAVEAPAPVADAAEAAHRGRILVVDDEALVVRSVQRALARDHDVVVTTASREALARCGAGERFDLIICDLMMPDMTGIELYQRLREIAPQQAERMIFLTGGAFTPAAHQFLSENPKEHIEKPFHVPNLRAIVQRWLR